MPYELCRHVMTTGKRCQSPALRDKNWCFYHDRTHYRHRCLRSAKKPAKNAPESIQIPIIDDPESVQQALSLVVAAVARGTLDDKRATTLLRALGIAARNAANINLHPYAPDVVRSFIPTLDGLPFAPRAMDDNSEPPERPLPTPYDEREDTPEEPDEVL